ncbi:MAG: phenylalanine--tRNA ligase beta subunit-related protein [Thaumarchaeota archaeon]|nr:phenylalanine--tRNA ligase beta subunit-related protein [Nitrososphaerota archaeon]MCL5318320.1 phenylalanine--tRNA ligase beta subunit-related protein [Nitrososphaerota archaeon]
MSVKIGDEVQSRFPGLTILLTSLTGLTVAKSDSRLEEFKKQVLQEVSGEYKLEALKDVYLFSVYRDFFWGIGIDPTKTRPASEALIRRVLAGKPIPQINTLVDAYNLASIKTGIPLAAFDADTVTGELQARFAQPDEEFSGIGMDKPVNLKGGEIVLTDDEKLVAIYPHRDSDKTKVQESTRNILLLTCGAPEVSADTLLKAEQTAVDYIIKFCSGQQQQK